LGVLVLPLSIWGLSMLGLSLLIGAILFLLVEKTRLLRFLSENNRIAVIMIISLVMGGVIIVTIWQYFNWPFI